MSEDNVPLFDPEFGPKAGETKFVLQNSNRSSLAPLKIVPYLSSFNDHTLNNGKDDKNSVNEPCNNPNQTQSNNIIDI